MTHGQPHNHIGTLILLRVFNTEGGYSVQITTIPACSDPSSSNNGYPPSFVNDNYYCESGNPTNTDMLASSLQQ